jgi:hypothetical protein
MWEYTEKDDINIEGIYMWFLPKFPNIDKELLHKRIVTGYCWGEGGFRLTTIESWEEVFGLVEAPYAQTVFENWEDWIKYDGNYHKKREDLGTPFAPKKKR